MSSLTFCNMRTLWRRMQRSLYPARRVASQWSFLFVLCVRYWAYTANICQLQLPSTTSPVRENVDLTKYQLKSPPCEEWLLEEIELNTVTISNMSIDSKLVETDGTRGRYRDITVDSGAGESVVNPDEWPNVDLKPSKGSVQGQRYLGPGTEKVDKL